MSPQQQGAVTTVSGRLRDALARDVRLGLEDLLEERDESYPDGTFVGRALWGTLTHPDSPSVVWHSQALETLLELGYDIDDPGLSAHLDFLDARLRDGNYYDPAEVTRSEVDKYPWLLRTRHVSWILRCLYPAHDMGVQGSGVESDRRAAIARRALAFLGGDRSRGVAAGWIGIRTGERQWSEHWRRRLPNLLNSIYAAWGVCRASRHGVHPETWPGQLFSPSAATTALVQSIVVEPGANGPRSRLAGEWVEPWAQGDLPCGVVALLALLLCEYAQLLAASQGEAAAQVFDQARRLGHELISRSPEWTDAVEGFSYAGAEGGWWYVPTYSLAVQAILDSAAAPPQHPVVIEALATITSLAIEGTHEGAAFESWRDPTRGSTLVRRFHADAAAKWYGIAHLSDVDLSRCEPTAGSIHASAMAWASVRRSFADGDPRTLLHQRNVPRLPESPFFKITLDAVRKSGQATVATEGGYTESIRVRAGAALLIDACGRLDRPADVSAIAEAVNAEAPEGVRATRTGEGVRAAVRDLNNSLGVALLRAESSDPPAYALSAKLHRRASAVIRQEGVSVDVHVHWPVLTPNNEWIAEYEFVHPEDDLDLSPGAAEIELTDLALVRKITLVTRSAHGTIGSFTAKVSPP